MEVLPPPTAGCTEPNPSEAAEGPVAAVPLCPAAHVRPLQLVGGSPLRRFGPGSAPGAGRGPAVEAAVGGRRAGDAL